MKRPRQLVRGHVRCRPQWPAGDEDTDGMNREECPARFWICLDQAVMACNPHDLLRDRPDGKDMGLCEMPHSAVKSTYKGVALDR